MAASVPVGEAAVDESELLRTLDRAPFDVTFHSAAGHGNEILLATSRGLVAVDRGFQSAKLLTGDPVTSVAWDEIGGRWIAAGPKGVWTADLGWFDPLAVVSGEVFESVTPSPLGILLKSRRSLWIYQYPHLRAVVTDSGGLFGRPAATESEISVIGFWSIHRIPVTKWAFGPAAEVPLPAELRSDLPIGVAYIGRSIFAVGQRSGFFILDSKDRQFPAAVLPPPLSRALIEKGFPDGWSDFAALGDEVYLLHADGQLHHLSAGRPIRQVTDWPQLFQLFRMTILDGRSALLYPYQGNYVLESASIGGRGPGRLKKWNFLTTSSGEILVRPGLPPDLPHSGLPLTWVRLNLSLGLAALVLALVGWSMVRGVPGLYRFHPAAAAYRDKLMSFERDRELLMQSLFRTEKEIHRTASELTDASGGADESLRRETEERLRSLRESRAALIGNIERFARDAAEEGRRIRAEPLSVRPAGSAAQPVLVRFLRNQTRGWERKFLRIARETEKILRKHESV